MKSSRREFLRTAGAAAVTTSTLRMALPALEAEVLRNGTSNASFFKKSESPGPSAIQVGYAAIAWGGDDSQAITDVSSLGYSGIQIRANAVKEFSDPHTLKDLLDQHRLKLAAFSSGDVLIDPSQQAANGAMHEANAKFVSAVGGNFLQVIGTFSHNNMTFSSDDYKRQAMLLTEVSRRVSTYGVKTGLHNHMGSIAQSPEQLERIMDASDPKYVHLLLDTGHYKQGGGDPAAAVKKYKDRLICLHLKDVKPSSLSGGYEFTELGHGTVDFPAVMAALHFIRFRGWVIVELDGKRSGDVPAAKQSAAMNKEYIEKTLGLRV
jgi:inosose dehydratase